jgi:enamine deaminase RidA (YjgF/YER057c/UK114 family)
LLFTPTGTFTTHPFFHDTLTYNQSDLVPVARVTNTLISITVPATQKLGSLTELITLARSQPGTLNFGQASQGFRAQATQVFENIKTALNSVGGDFEHVVKITTYLTDIEQNADAYREVRASFFANRATLPASTLLQITRLANPSYLIEVEVMAVLPPRA